MTISNESFYKRAANFSGSLEEWFNDTVVDQDLFRVWYKDRRDEECIYVYITNVIKIGDDYLLGLVSYEDDDNNKTITYSRLSDISSIAILTNEENLK